MGVANLLLRAGDAWSVWVLNSTMTEQLEDRLILVMTFGQYDGSGPVSEDGATQAGLTVSALLVILLGIIVIIVTVIQMILMIFREAVIIILAALLPLAAVGMMMRATQSWLPRVSSWMLALIFYKPAVAMVYATTFVFIGGDEQPTIRTFIAGLMMLMLSLVAMQTLLSLFNWATGAVASPGGSPVCCGTSVPPAQLWGWASTTPPGVIYQRVAGFSWYAWHGRNRQRQKAGANAPQKEDPPQAQAFSFR